MNKSPDEFFQELITKQKAEYDHYRHKHEGRSFNPSIPEWVDAMEREYPKLLEKRPPKYKERLPEDLANRYISKIKSDIKMCRLYIKRGNQDITFIRACILYESLISLRDAVGVKYANKSQAQIKSIGPLPRPGGRSTIRARVIAMMKTQRGRYETADEFIDFWADLEPLDHIDGLELEVGDDGSYTVIDSQAEGDSERAKTYKNRRSLINLWSDAAK